MELRKKRLRWSGVQLYCSLVVLYLFIFDYNSTVTNALQKRNPFLVCALPKAAPRHQRCTSSLRMCHCSVTNMEKALFRYQDKPLSVYIPSGPNTQSTSSGAKRPIPSMGMYFSTLLRHHEKSGAVCYSREVKTVVFYLPNLTFSSH